jgi:hypothetical protein
MTNQFRDLDEFLVDRPIELPIRGKTYRFPGSVSARTGLLLQRMGASADVARRSGQDGTAAASEVFDAELLDDDREKDLRREIMGDGEAEMARDGLTTAHTEHVFRTLIVWHMAGEEAALKAWERLGNVQAPNRETRRQASKASGTSTRRRASTAGTTASKKRPQASAGRSSSRSGR